MIRVFAAFPVVILAATAPALAQASSPDQHFLDSALTSDQTTADLSDYEGAHGQSDAVRQLAKQLGDSAKSGKHELSDLTQSIRGGQAIDVKPTAEDLSELARMRQMSGANLDHQYVQSMINRHTEDVHDYGLEAQQAQDAKVKSLAQRKLPELQHELQQAEDLDSQVFGAAKVQNNVALDGKTWPLDVNGHGPTGK